MNDREADDAEGEGFDLEQARELAGFVLRAARRRPRLAWATFAVVASLGLTIAATMPRTYTAAVKLLAQRSSAIRMLSSSTPGMDNVDNPTRNVASTIMRHDNLVALVREANLVERFAATRPPALRLKDRVMARLFGPPSDEDMQTSMVNTLEAKLDVTTDDPASTVVIKVDWSNPVLAYDLVTLVQKNFLEARYDNDVAMITDSIAVLEEHSKNELAQVDAELEEYQKVVATRAVKPPPVAAPRTVSGGMPQSVSPAQAAVPDRPDPDLAKALEEKRLQIRTAEETHQRTLEALRQQLVQAQLTLTPMHPTVMALQEKLDALSRSPTELVELRGEERSLMAQIAPPKPLASAALVPRVAGLRLRAAIEGDAGAEPAALPSLSAFDPDRDGPLQLAQSKLALSIRAYEDSLARLDGAKVELDITRTAYKHQYTVVTPAEVPRTPKKATAQVIGGVSVVAAALLALLIAAAADMMTGLVLESWQVKRQLKLEVLAELDRPS